MGFAGYLMIAADIVAIALIAVVLIQGQSSSGLGSVFGGTDIYRTRRGIEKTLFNITFLLAGIFLWLRFLYFYAIGIRGVGRFSQSVTIGTGLLLVGLLIFIFGVLADIISKQRQLTQESLYRLKKMELEASSSPLFNEPGDSGGDGRLP